jgi:GT2 family glycosyltransferase
MPHFSLIITVFNREHFLEETIKTVLIQSASDLELLIWDDGSTDNSPERLFAPHIGWVDSDDLLAPNALAKTAAILERYPSVGLIYSRYNVIDAAGKFLGLGKRCHTLYSKNQLLTLLVTFHFRLIRRNIYEQVGGINPELDAKRMFIK